MRTLWKSAVAGLAGLALAACGSSAAAPSTAPAGSSAAGSVAAQSSAGAAAKPAGWDQLVSDAKKEGTVSVYGPPGVEYRPVLIDAFQKAYPDIKVEFISGDSNERVSRLTTERAAGKYLADLLVDGTTNEVTVLKESKTIVDLKPALILPEVVDENAWLGHQLAWADASAPFTTLMFQGGVNNIIFYNTNMVKPTDFSSYWDLLDPKWKGKIVATDIRNPGPGGVPSRFMYKNPDLGPTFLKRFFGETGVTLSNDQRQMVDWVAKGQYPLGVLLSDTDVQTAIGQGLPIAPVPADRLKEGASIGPGYGGVVLVDRAPHPNAAKVYINWLLSKEGQIAWQKEVKAPSLRIDIPKDQLPQAQVPKPDVKYTNGGTEEFSRLTSSTIRDLINQSVPKS